MIQMPPSLGSGAQAGMSMPAAVPGLAGPLPMPPTGPSPGAPPGVLGFPDPQGGGGLPKYHAEAQADGTILLRALNPDGSPGVVLKVIQGVRPKAGPGGI